MSTNSTSVAKSNEFFLDGLLNVIVATPSSRSNKRESLLMVSQYTVKSPDNHNMISMRYFQQKFLMGVSIIRFLEQGSTGIYQTV